MLLRRVALVLFERVLRVFLRKFFHQSVTVDLCHDRSGRNRRAFCVAAHDGVARHGYVSCLVAVDKRKIGLDGKIFYGSAHRQKRGVEYVYFVYLRRGRFAYAHGDRFFENDGVQFFPLLFGKFFRVVYSLGHKVLGQYHRRRHNRSAQRSSAHFVNAAHKRAVFCVILFVERIIHSFFSSEIRATASAPPPQK